MTIILLLNVAIAIWMKFDGRKRSFPVLLWCVAVMIFGPLVFPIYLAKRPLLDGEVREGGTPWNVLKNFSLFWTVYLFVGWIVGMGSASKLNATTDAEKLGAGIGILLGTGLIFALWFFPTLTALILGLFLKKNSIVERGPTVRRPGGLPSNLATTPDKPDSTPIGDGTVPVMHSTSTQTPKAFMDAVSSFSKTSKDAARLVARQTERAKLLKVTLPSAFRALGKNCFENQRHRSSLETYFIKVDQITAELATLKHTHTGESASKSIGDMGKSAAKRVTDLAQSQSISLKLSSAFVDLGKAAFEQFQEESGPDELKKPIREGQDRLAVLDRELADLSVASKGSWITPKRFVYAAAGLLLFVVIGMLGNNKDSGADSSSGEEDERTGRYSENQTTSKKTNKSKKGTYEVGDEFQLGKFKYRVSGATARSVIGSQFGSEEASSGATFLIVSYSIENCSNESQTVLADDLKLMDSKGRKFESSSRGNTALMLHSNKNDFAISELQPGIARSQETAFEIPTNVLDGDLTLVVPEKGFFSSGQAKVKLR